MSKVNMYWLKKKESFSTKARIITTVPACTIAVAFRKCLSDKLTLDRLNYAYLL